MINTEWMESAECRTNPEAMFPDAHKTRPSTPPKNDWAKPRKLCSDCPVLSACETWVLKLPFHEPVGMIAGMTPKERLNLRRATGKQTRVFPSPVADRRTSPVKIEGRPHANQYTA